MEKIVWGIDPGSSICGVCELNSGLIGNCFNCEPEMVYHRIMSLCGLNSVTIVIEDISAYSKKLSDDTIETCKVIGDIRKEFQIRSPNVRIEYVARSTVRNWIFNTVPDVVIPRVIARMEYIDKQIRKKWAKEVLDGTAEPDKPPRGLRDKTGKLYAPHFKYVDDRIVIAALKKLYNIPTPKPGKSNIFGLKDHSWQALAVCSYFFHSLDSL